MKAALLTLCLCLPLQAATPGRSGRSSNTVKTVSDVPSIGTLQSPLDSPLVQGPGTLKTLAPALSLTPVPTLIPNLSQLRLNDVKTPAQVLVVAPAQIQGPKNENPLSPDEQQNGAPPQNGPDQRGLGQRMAKILSRILNPFGLPPKNDDGQPLDSLSVGEHVSYAAKGRAETGLLVRLDSEEAVFAVAGEKGWALKTYKPKNISAVKALKPLAEDAYKDAAQQTKVVWSSAKARGAQLEGYRRFKKSQDALWLKISPALGAEVDRLRAITDAREKKEYLRQTGRDIMARLHKAHGTRNIGFHFNLHGGQADEYAQGGGIRATMGDIALNYSMNGDRNYKVYFFQSAKHELYDILDTGNPAMVLGGGRMGHVLNLFKLDSKFMKEGLASGALMRMGDISVDFDTSKADMIPYDTYIAPPMELFLSLGKKTGLGRLSRDEETLAAMRYIESVALSEERFIP